jgi:hypothetical protein
MKRFIYIVVLLAGCQFAQAQKVKEIVVLNGNAYYPLDGGAFTLQDSVLPPSMSIAFYLQIENNGREDLAATDSIALDITLNNSPYNPITVPMVAGLKKDSTAIRPAGLRITFDSNTVKSGAQGIPLCVNISAVVINGARTPVNNAASCATFTVKFISTADTTVNPGDSVSIADIDNLKEATIFPNPVRDQLKIENLNETTDVCLYNITGQLVQRVPSVRGKATIDVRNLSNGLYILRMQSGKNIRTEKVHVVR